MKNTITHITIWTLLGLLVLLTSCKTAKRSSGSADLNEKSAKILLKRLSKNRIEADWLSAEARATYKDDNETRKFNLNFRYRKDSIIWLNVKKATVEAFRIQMTPDSFFLIDRLNKEYYVNSIDAIEERFNLPQRTTVDQPIFKVLEDILLGNPIFFAGSPLEAGIDGKEYTLKGKSKHFESAYRIEGTDYLLTAMDFVADDERQNLKVEIDRSEFLEDYPKFSYIRSYTVHDPQRGQVEIKLRFKDLEIDKPKTIRFEIPSNYKRIE